MPGHTTGVLVDLCSVGNLYVSRLVDPVKIGRQVYGHKQHGLAEPLYVHGIVLKPSGDLENTGFGDDVSFVLRSQENLDFRIEVGRQIRQLGSQKK